MTPRSFRRTALAAIAAATLSACGGAAGTSDAGAPATSAPSSDGGPTAQATAPSGEGGATAPSSDASQPTGEAGNAEALAFTGVDLDGQPLDAQAYAGGDVVLWMWAPW